MSIAAGSAGHALRTRRWVGLAVAWAVALLALLALPRLPLTGAGLSRGALLLCGLPIALAAGAAVAYGLNIAYPTVNDAQALRALTGRPVLGGVSELGATYEHGQGRDDARFALALLALLLVYGVWCAAVVGWRAGS